MGDFIVYTCLHRGSGGLGGGEKGREGWGEIERGGGRDRQRQRQSSNLVFYAQSTTAVISERERVKERNRREKLIERGEDSWRERERGGWGERGGGGGGVGRGGCTQLDRWELIVLVLLALNQEPMIIYQVKCAEICWWSSFSNILIGNQR